MKDIKSVSSSSVNMKLDNYKESHRQMQAKITLNFLKEQIQIENIFPGKGRLPVIGELKSGELIELRETRRQGHHYPSDMKFTMWVWGQSVGRSVR